VVRKKIYLEAEDHEDDQHAASKTGALVRRRREAKEADDKQNREDSGETNEVDGSTTEARHDPPRDEAPNKTKTVLANGKVERVVLAQTNTLHKLRAETHERHTAKCLCDESHGRDFGAVQVAALEQVPVVASGADLLLILIRNNHHLNVRIQIELNAICWGSDFANRSLGLVDAALSDEPPGRFGSEQSGEDDGGRPDPLQREGDAVAPLRGVLHEAGEDAGGEKAADDPAHVDPGGHVASQVSWAEIGGVRDREGLENTPWQSLDDTTDEEHLETGGEEGNADGAGHEDHAANHGFLVSDPFGNVAIDNETQNASNLSPLALLFWRVDKHT
jgi:hypothetical protein